MNILVLDDSDSWEDRPARMRGVAVRQWQGWAPPRGIADDLEVICALENEAPAARGEWMRAGLYDAVRLHLPQSELVLVHCHEERLAAKLALEGMTQQRAATPVTSICLLYSWGYLPTAPETTDWLSGYPEAVRGRVVPLVSSVVDLDEWDWAPLFRLALDPSALGANSVVPPSSIAMEILRDQALDRRRADMHVLRSRLVPPSRKTPSRLRRELNACLPGLVLEASINIVQQFIDWLDDQPEQPIEEWPRHLVDAWDLARSQP